jgi:hypothetical protein
VIILDTLLIGGVRFVLDKVAAAVDAELSDAGRLREELLAAQMRHELGEISDEEFASAEADLLARIRDLKAREQGGDVLSSEWKVTGVEATFGGDESEQ